ncbi:MAG TPA: dephospho-CoA kinase [Candidatus Deferrimicrobiaceae bacterium]
MRVYGLTGNIGSGKSTVAAMFREAGIPVLDADRISREVTAPGSPAYRGIVKEFGTGILGPDGAIDREKLAGIVFSDPSRRALLERITHPAILAEMKESMGRLAREGHAAAIVEAALVHESGRKGLLEAVIAVRCDPSVQLRRLAARGGMTREQAEARMAAQMDPEEKARASDYVIDNSGDLEATRRQVERLARSLLAGHTS